MAAQQRRTAAPPAKPKRTTAKTPKAVEHPAHLPVMLYTAPEVAVILGVSEAEVRQRILSKTLPAIRLSPHGPYRVLAKNLPVPTEPVAVTRTCVRCDNPLQPDQELCYQCMLGERREIHEKASYRALWLEQEGKCAVCGKKSSRLVVDHDHETGYVRGLLCTPCNTGLGQFADKPDRLRAAIAYLECGGIQSRQITYRQMIAARSYDPKDRRIRRRKRKPAQVVA